VTEQNNNKQKCEEKEKDLTKEKQRLDDEIRQNEMAI